MHAIEYKPTNDWIMYLNKNSHPSNRIGHYNMRMTMGLQAYIQHNTTRHNTYAKGKRPTYLDIICLCLKFNYPKLFKCWFSRAKKKRAAWAHCALVRVRRAQEMRAHRCVFVCAQGYPCKYCPFGHTNTHMLRHPPRRIMNEWLFEIHPDKKIASHTARSAEKQRWSCANCAANGFCTHHGHVCTYVILNGLHTRFKELNAGYVNAKQSLDMWLFGSKSVVN